MPMISVKIDYLSSPNRFMKRILPLLTCLMLVHFGWSQSAPKAAPVKSKVKKKLTLVKDSVIPELPIPSFAGKVSYRIQFRSKQPTVTSSSLEQALGSSEDFFVKNGKYKATYNGNVMQYQIYHCDNNRLFTKKSTSPMIEWQDAGISKDSVLSSKINPDAIQILGYSCDELVLTTATSTEKYYFSPRFHMDSTDYVMHKYGNWATYVGIAKAVPLKMIIETPEFIMTAYATEAKKMELPEGFFNLPSGVMTYKAKE